MADPMLATSNHRTAIFGVAAVACKANASAISAPIQKAFDDWQAANTDYHRCQRLVMQALKRFDAMLPDQDRWHRINRPVTPEQQAAIRAANKTAGINTAEKAASIAFSKTHNALLHFLHTEPETMADVRLQAKHLAQWLEDCEVEHPILVWLETLTKGQVA